MFNLGFSEMLLLAAIALIFIGPKQLPEVARTIARMLNELKRATSDLKFSLFDQENEPRRRPFDQAGYDDDPAEHEPSPAVENQAAVGDHPSESASAPAEHGSATGSSSQATEPASAAKKPQPRPKDEA